MFQERFINNYKDKPQTNALVLTVLKNKNYQEYLAALPSYENDPENLFGLKQFFVAKDLTEYLVGALENEKIFQPVKIKKVSIYKTRLVILLDEIVNSFELISLVSKHTTENLVTSFFNNPEFTQESYLIPDEIKFEKPEISNFDIMYRLFWVAHRTRILGELYLGIPAESKYYSIEELSEAVLEEINAIHKSSFESLTKAIDSLYHPALKYGGWYENKKWFGMTA